MRAPTHVVASYAWQAWVFSRRGEQLPPRFGSYPEWARESQKWAPMRQTLFGCVAVRKNVWAHQQPPDPQWWRNDCAELADIIRTRILPAVARPADSDAFECGTHIACGTLRGYNLGGRCNWCALTRRMWRARRPALVCGTDKQCGTPYGYWLGGRCDACCHAGRAYQYDRYHNGVASFVCGEDARCGSAAGYKAGGRCDDCKAMRAAYMRAYRAKRRGT